MTLLREAKLKAHQNHIILVMRAGLDDKIWWGFDDIAEQLAMSPSYISTITKGMRERGVLITKEKHTKPVHLKLNTILAVSIPKSAGDVSYLGPIPVMQVELVTRLCTADGISLTMWIDRATRAYSDKRAEILREGW